MKTATFFLTVSVALVSAQITIEDGIIKCPKPFGAYCVGGSLETDIIARCDSAGIGRRGRCSDNMAGMPPVGNTLSLCYQSSDVSGDASCEKNCVVYGASGNGNGTFTLPASECTPTYTASESIVSSTSTGTGYPPPGSDSSSSTTCTESHPPAVPTGGAPIPPPPPPITPPGIPTPTAAPVPPTDTWAPLPPQASTTTTGFPTVPTAAAPVVKRAGIAMAAFGVAVACLL